MQRRISHLLAFVLLAFGIYQIWQALASLLD